MKEKRESVIAYIDMESLLEISAVTNTWDESWEIDMKGVFRGTIRYDITHGKFIKTKIFTAPYDQNRIPVELL